MEAIDTEFTLHQYGTWELGKRSAMAGSKAIASRWVFTGKCDENKKINRFKACVVIHGFNQQHHLDYTETCAPVVHFGTIRAAICYALQHAWQIMQYGIKSLPLPVQTTPQPANVCVRVLVKKSLAVVP